MDVEDLLKRNREFAGTTQLTNLLIVLEGILSKETDDILRVLYSNEQSDTTVLNDLLVKKIHKSKLIKEFLDEIREKYNIIPGQTIQTNCCMWAGTLEDLRQRVKSKIQECENI